MKKKVLIVILILVISPLYAQDGIRWISMNEALEAQKEAPKKILMDVYTSWCGPCKLLDKNTFGNKDVIKYVNKNYYPVKFNAEGTESVTYQDFTYTNPNYQEGRKGRNSQHLLALGKSKVLELSDGGYQPPKYRDDLTLPGMSRKPYWCFWHCCHWASKGSGWGRHCRDFCLRELPLPSLKNLTLNPSQRPKRTWRP